MLDELDSGDSMKMGRRPKGRAQRPTRSSSLPVLPRWLSVSGILGRGHAAPLQQLVCVGSDLPRRPHFVNRLPVHGEFVLGLAIVECPDMNPQHGGSIGLPLDGRDDEIGRPCYSSI